MTLTKKDFQSDNEVRWCPGCGDYAILASVQKTLAELNFKPHETVFVSGIGCASRFPYYMQTYGMHTIHGRGPAFASGIKLSNPKLKVFLVTGDGDGLSIGANHLLHLFRRNIDITVLMFNNQIYGLTKGQYSPTSNQGLVAKSTPFGSLEKPVNPVGFALSAGATFVARSIDSDAQHLGEMLKAAIAHKGCSFVEILQNCVVFNDKAFAKLRDKNSREQKVLTLREKEPLLFAECQKGIAIDRETFAPKIVEGANLSQALIFDSSNLIKSQMVANFGPEFPTPLGVFRRSVEETFEDLKSRQDAQIFNGSADLSKLLRGNNYWQV